MCFTWLFHIIFLKLLESLSGGILPSQLPRRGCRHGSPRTWPSLRCWRWNFPGELGPWDIQGIIEKRHEKPMTLAKKTYGNRWEETSGCRSSGWGEQVGTVKMRWGYWSIQERVFSKWQNFTVLWVVGPLAIQKIVLSLLWPCESELENTSTARLPCG